MTGNRPPLAVRAMSYEAAMWRSLFRWIGGRHKGVPDTFRYSGPIMMVLWAFIGVSIVELPILHLLLPWPTVRLIVDILSLYGLVWMFGLMASVKVNPHALTEAGVRIRNNIALDVTVPWSDIASVRTRTRTLPPGKGIRIETEGDRRVLFIAIASGTSVDLILREPTVSALPKGDTEPVDEIRIWADDAKAMAARIKEFLAVHSPDPERR